MSLQDSPTSNFSVQPFLPPVQLTFLLGPQADKEVVFGFGPRQIGSNCLDLEVIEDAAPGVSFELFSDKNAAHFKTEHPAVVWLNDEKISHRPLKDCDTIRIGGTLIRVNFVEFSSPKENP